MGTLQKSQCHEKSIRARQFVTGAEKRDFLMRRSSRSLKITNTEHLCFAIRIVLMFKTVFKIVIFRKVVDGNHAKIL